MSQEKRNAGDRSAPDPRGAVTSTPARRRDLLITAALVAAVFATYWQVRTFEFISYDDGVYVTGNETVQKGLTVEGFIWAFTTGHGANWHPLTWLSHLLDVSLFGLDPAGHHMTSVVFHAINTVLLFFLFKAMTGAVWESVFVAAFFALHPLRVESVAWVSERKDVLSTLFWFLTMLAYVRYVRRPEPSRYVLVAVGLAVGLMAKPMLVTLPFVLLLMDFWPLNRFGIHSSGTRAGASVNLSSQVFRSTALRLFKEKLPLIAIVIASSVVTFLVQREGGAVARVDEFTMEDRIQNALMGYVRYLGKVVWPEGLAVFYPYQTQWPFNQLAGAVIILVSLTLLALLTWRRMPYVSAGWFWYVGTLLPVIGLVQVGSQSIADRYTYVPVIGISFLVIWSIRELVMNRTQVRRAAGVGGFVILAVLAGATWVQASHWQNSVSLFKHTAEVTTNSWVVHFNFGIAYTAKGEYEEAISHYRKAIEIHQRDPEAEHGLGVVLVKVGKIDEAIPHYLKAIEIKPDHHEAYNNLGAAYAMQGKMEEARKQYTEALRIKADYAEAHNNLGSLLAEQGELDEAIRHFLEALKVKPDYQDARNNLERAQAGHTGRAQEISVRLERLKTNPADIATRLELAGLLRDQGRTAAALEQYRDAVRLHPDNIEARKALASLLSGQGRLQEAITELDEVLRVAPRDVDVRNELGMLLGRAGRMDDAVKHLAEAVRINPASADARNNLGIAMAMQGNTAKAVENFTKALQIKPDHWNAHFNLGLVRAQQGNTVEAKHHFGEALRIRPDYAEARAELEKIRQKQ